MFFDFTLCMSYFHMVITWTSCNTDVDRKEYGKVLCLHMTQPLYELRNLH